ncbi:MAG: zf-TFIIB domain-containing protein [Deltaproteobacteria bacterium]|nr:zf-TFIIB domain-containing protein [Deltaproteobacteria bacterium]
MRCPKCGMPLDEITFRGVKVDKCFGCGGVYLDDGELEELAGKPGWFEAMRYFFSSR